MVTGSGTGEEMVSAVAVKLLNVASNAVVGRESVSLPGCSRRSMQTLSGPSRLESVTEPREIAPPPSLIQADMVWPERLTVNVPEVEVSALTVIPPSEEYPSTSWLFWFENLRLSQYVGPFVPSSVSMS